jgi:rhamnose utilization protein RhaD (predicted bifunctional aldolase and dehydrogenase)
MRGNAAKVDANQPEIVEAFRQLHCSVQHLHAVGSGCPDLLVGVNGFNVLVEVKTATGELTNDQKDFIAAWRGDAVNIVRSRDDVIELVNHYRRLGKQPRIIPFGGG